MKIGNNLILCEKCGSPLFIIKKSRNIKEGFVANLICCVCNKRLIFDKEITIKLIKIK